MSRQPYNDLCFGLQALRRQVERYACDLQGALGVQARPLPHQVANVQRVLTAPAVRHLLADEVGLGKTVQALMVINALRLQRPDLRVLIVVPDALMAQWRDEYVARAHEAPVEGSERFDGGRERFSRLAWPRALRSPTEIDPDRYDMLVVDEFHDLTRALQVRILDAAADFQHLLLLSATPPFQDPERADELMQMLEPTWAAALEGQGRLLHAVRQREAEAAALLETDDTDAWAPLGGAPPGDDAAAVSLAWCAYRRVIRTRREDWRSHLPRREHHTVMVEPLAAEAERERLMWRYFHHLGDLSRDFNLDKLAQRVIRSAASLRQRVTYLKGHGHERQNLLAQVDELLKAERGDSRFEALCDTLAEIWRQEPDAKVLVAAGDNLTVDDLAKRVPLVLDRVGPADAGREVVVSTARNQAKSAMDFDDPDGQDEVQVAAAAFVSGEANLLVAADIAKLGLNLQCTRHVVLYSIPWDPQEVEQWLGRVDRIGNTAIEDPTSGELRPIVIHTIVQRGLVDERVLRVIEASGVLQRSLSLDSARVNEVRELIRSAALQGHGADWTGLEARAAELGASFDLAELGSPLLADLPWAPDRARALHQRLERLAPVEPVHGPELDGLPGFEARELALLRWIQAMRDAGIYEVRHHKQRGFGTIRCQAIPRPHGRPIINTVGHLGDDLFGEKGRPAYFIARRRDMTQPPRKEVVFDDGGVYRLHFLSHGSPLHEALVRLWSQRGATAEGAARLQLPSGHPAEVLRGTTVLVLAAMADPAALMPGPLESLRVACADGGLEEAQELAHSDKGVLAQYEADVRLLRELLPTRLLVVGARLRRGVAERVDAEVLRWLLDPTAKSPDGRTCRADTWEHVDAHVVEAAEEATRRARRWMADALAQAWTPRLPAVRRALELRSYLGRCDEADRVLAAARQQDEMEAELAALGPEDDWGRGEKMRAGRLRRLLRQAGHQAEAEALVARARRGWLAAAADAAGAPEPSVCQLVLLKVR